MNDSDEAVTYASKAAYYAAIYVDEGTLAAAYAAESAMAAAEAAMAAAYAAQEGG